MKLFKYLSLILSLIFIESNGFATHIIGGEMNYLYLGNNNYQIKLTIYRDCLTGQAAYDNPAMVGVFNASGTLIQSMSITFPGSDTVQPQINYYCGLTIPTNICVEKATYTFQLNLPPSSGGYTIEYQRCCRNASILNIVDPGGTGDTFLAKIPDFNTVGADNNPVFTNWPPVFICQGLPIIIDHSATDADGDSLVYSLCTPYEGADALNPMPTPNTFTPAIPLIWNPPYSVNNMLGSVPQLVINSNTGMLTGVANTLGRFVVGISVKEYRNGNYIGETIRDFQFNVVNCNLSVVSAFVAPDTLCDEYIQFNNLSTGATQYFWNFGVDTLTNDTSNLYNPTYTFPGPGTYTVTLIAYDDDCSDTNTVKIVILPEMTLNAGPDKYFCSGTNGVQIGFPDNTGNYSYSWSPPTGLSNQNISNPIANPLSTTTYVLTKSDSICSGEDTVVVYVTQTPEASFLYTLEPKCENIAGVFTSTSQPVTGIHWLFSNGYTSTVTPLAYNFNYDDSVDIYLIAYNGSCTDTFKLNNPLHFSGIIKLPPPNVITPNSDNLNDCFGLITAPQFENCYTLQVFNRWGKKVFEKDSSHKCWDGKNRNNGKELSEGVYYYIITIGEKSYQGSVTLIKQ